MDITQEGNEIGHIVHWLAFETVLKEMSSACIFAIEVNGIHHRQMLDSLTDVFVMRLDKQVHMV